MRNIIIAAILTLLFICCVNKREKTSRFTKEQIASLQLGSTKRLNVNADSLITIDVNPLLNDQSYKIDTLIKDIKLIPLETTNESLLDNIRKVIVTDSNIYIHDDFKDGGIVIFDSDGKFIKRISNGKGPGELLRLYDIAFDEENDELVVYQHSYLLFFTPSGKYIRQEKLPFGFHKFTVIPGGYVFKTIDRQGNGHLGHLQDFTLLVTNKNFKIKSVGLPYLPSEVNLEKSEYLYKNATTLLVTHKFTDTIYEYKIKEEQLIARYSLNYSSKKLPDKYLDGTFQEFETAAEQNDYSFYLGEYCSTETHDVFFFENWYTELLTVIYRDKKSGNLKGGTGIRYNLNEIPGITRPWSSYDNFFISWYYPGEDDLFSTNSTVISETDKQKVKGLTRNDNPVLVFYTLKNF